MKQLEEKLKTITEEKRKLIERMSSEKSENEEIVKEHIKNIALLKTELEQQKSQSEKLQRRLDAYQNKSDAEKNSFSKCQADLSECKSQNLTLKAEIRKNESAIKCLDNEIARLKEICSVKEEEVKSIEDFYKDQKRDYDNLKIVRFISS